MAIIVVTDPNQVVSVKNGDTVVLNLADGESVTIVAANPGVRNFKIDYGDDETTDNIAIVDLDTFSADNLQILTSGYDSADRLTLDGASNQSIDPQNLNVVSFDYGDGLSGTAKILDPRERDLTIDPPPIIICFAEGTTIDTDLGPVPVESLGVGAMVHTEDHGLQPVRWVGRTSLGRERLAAFPHMRPIRIRAGAMGGGLPWRDLVVSPQHRIKLSDWRAQLLFGEADVLAPAKALVDGVNVVEDPTDSVTYYHLLFDRHEIIRSNGLLTESLHPGDMAMIAMLDSHDGDVTNIFAEAAEDLARRPTARRALRVFEGKAARGYAA